jgi:cytochrome c oxidase assembly protein subunit 15
VALLLAAATFPLLWVGGLVTTTKAGMAVPDWPSTYGYNLFLYPWETWLYGPWDLFIEHGHRLFAALVGMLTIVLVGLTWWCGSSGRVRQLALVALGLVIFQGVLGGLRVVLNAPLVAMLHGVVGPFFFVLTVALAAMTSEEWESAEPDQGDPAVRAKLERFAWLTFGLAYLQIGIGAYLRHLPGDVTPQMFQIAILFHILVALALVVHIGLVAWQVFRSPLGERGPLFWPALWLVGLVGVQLVLGVNTWIVKYGWPAFLGEWAPAGYVNVAHGFWQTHIVTAHVAVGSLILAQAGRLGLWCRRLAPATDAAPAAASEVSRSADLPRISSQLVGVTA